LLAPRRAKIFIIKTALGKMSSVENNVVKIKEKNKAVKILYIEADQDRVALQIWKQ
jgi:hypothetical protein